MEGGAQITNETGTSCRCPWAVHTAAGTALPPASISVVRASHHPPHPAPPPSATHAALSSLFASLVLARGPMGGTELRHWVPQLGSCHVAHSPTHGGTCPGWGVRWRSGPLPGVTSEADGENSWVGHHLPGRSSPRSGDQDAVWPRVRESEADKGGWSVSGVLHHGWGPSGAALVTLPFALSRRSQRGLCEGGKPGGRRVRGAPR